MIVSPAQTDIKALTSDGPDILPSLAPAFEKYNESQLATVKLPENDQEVRSNGGINLDAGVTIC